LSFTASFKHYVKQYLHTPAGHLTSASNFSTFILFFKMWTCTLYNNDNNHCFMAIIRANLC